MPEPAGTGLSRRSFLSRSAGLALAVYGASKIPLSAFEEGIAQAAADRQDPRLGLLRRRHRLAQRAGPGRRLPLLAAAPEPRPAPPAPAPPSPRTRRLQWHPAAAGLATLHAEGKVSAFPAIGYDHPDQSHFTSRHYYEIGELEVGFRTGWLGRYIDRSATTRTRCRASRWTARSRR